MASILLLVGLAPWLFSHSAWLGGGAAAACLAFCGWWGDQRSLMVIDNRTRAEAGATPKKTPA